MMNAPDFSLPDSPNLRDAFRAFAPPGTDTDELMRSLKASQIGPAGTSCAACAGHGITAVHLPHGEECRMVQAVAAKNAAEQPRIELDADQAGRWDAMNARPARDLPGLRELAARPSLFGDLPADPSPGDLMAGIGIAQMLESMTSGGVPLASAERIIGAMLAVHGIMAAADDDHRD